MKIRRPECRWHYDLATRQGDRKEQQDRAVVLDCPDQTCSLVILADGLGGQSLGAQAAQIVIDCARQEFSDSPLDNPGEFLNMICLKSHERIRAMREEHATQAGSTCVLLLLTESEAHWVHVGDSRLYHFNATNMVCRTRDHSLSELRQSGMISQANQKSTEQDNHLLYMCLGGDNDIRPEYGAISLTKDDWFLLCTDGVWSGLQPWEMTSAFSPGKDFESSALQLAEIAIRRNTPAADNASIILAISPEPEQSILPFKFNSLFNSLMGKLPAH